MIKSEEQEKKEEKRTEHMVTHRTPSYETLRSI